MLYVVDVLEEELVLVGDQPLDLLGVHPAVIVNHVENGLIERRKDILLHADDAVDAAQGQGEHQHHHRHRPAQREDNWVHRDLKVPVEFRTRCEFLASF